MLKYRCLKFLNVYCNSQKTSLCFSMNSLSFPDSFSISASSGLLKAYRSQAQQNTLNDLTVLGVVLLSRGWVLLSCSVKTLTSAIRSASRSRRERASRIGTVSRRPCLSKQLIHKKKKTNKPLNRAINGSLVNDSKKPQTDNNVRHWYHGKLIS